MAVLGLDFLRFLDGQERQQAEDRVVIRHQKLLDTVVRGSLVAADRYEEKLVFPDYFPDEEAEGDGGDDSNVDFDYGGVEWSTPAEEEMAILQRMLGDNSVSIPGSSLPPEEDPFDVPMELPDNSPVMEQIANDREWV